MIFHKSVQLVGYTDNRNIMGRTKRAISEVYKKLRDKKQHNSTSVSKKNKQTKAMVVVDEEEKVEELVKYLQLMIIILKLSAVSNT
jgi:hypothetical protein